jgi:hypothetical protein
VFALAPTIPAAGIATVTNARQNASKTRGAGSIEENPLVALNAAGAVCWSAGASPHLRSNLCCALNAVSQAAHGITTFVENPRSVPIQAAVAKGAK